MSPTSTVIDVMFGIVIHCLENGLQTNTTVLRTGRIAR